MNTTRRILSLSIARGLAIVVALALVATVLPATAWADSAVRVGTFQVDATPEVGSPVAYAPARKILQPLSARGIVLLAPANKPIVLCAVDFIGIGNGGYDAWRKALAEAAGTDPQRVAVHSLHQHDAPRCDFTAQQLLAEQQAAEPHFDEPFLRRTIQSAAQGVRKAVESAEPVTHVGIGSARIEKVASNRRLLGPDGKVRLMRWSSSTNEEAIAAPEGLIDPMLQMISFWQGDRPVVALTYYATHPQSYYGKGDVNPEFVGMARASREQATDGTLHVHFNGAGGNVAAGKYNDGSEKMRPILAERLAAGMQRAWDGTKRMPLEADDIGWKTVAVPLPVSQHLEAEKLRPILADTEADPKQRLAAASHLAWLQRCQSGYAIELTRLDVGNATIVHMPGELFVEYQLAAQKMRPDRTVAMAAYGDYGPGYIGITEAYAQGGYEVSPGASRVAPQVEQVLMPALRELLESP